MAQLEKEKGNAAFKAANYPEAVGHYSAAIFADSSDPTLPLNRAAAYLKLGKNADAERDCSTVLSLKPGHVKALYRRAQARMELQKLDEARQDLLAALKVEPSNAAVKTELQKLDKIGSSSKGNHSSGVRNGIEARPHRRRVPIDIIDESSITESDQLRPVSSRTLSKGSTEASPNSAPSTSTPSSREPVPKEKPKQAEKQKRSERESDAGSTSASRGGIFRPSGEHTLFRQPLQLDSSSERRTNTASNDFDELETSPPFTFVEFLQSWELASPGERWKLLCQIQPRSLPYLFNNLLEANILMQIVDVCNAAAAEGNEVVKQRIKAYLRYFPQVSRFNTITLFLNEEENEKIRSLHEAVGAAPWTI